MPLMSKKKEHPDEFTKRKFREIFGREPEEDIKNYRDFKNMVDTAREEGRKEGLKEIRKLGKLEAKKEVAKKMKNGGLSTTEISDFADLSEDEIAKL